MGDIRLYCLVLLVLSGKTRQLLGRFREFDEHLVADDAHRILLQFCVLGFNPGARLCVELPKMFCTSDYFTIKGAWQSGMSICGHLFWKARIAPLVETKSRLLSVPGTDISIISPSGMSVLAHSLIGCVFISYLVKAARGLAL